MLMGVSRVFSATNCGGFGLSTQPNGARISLVAICLTASLVSAPWRAHECEAAVHVSVRDR